jgi:hypothetical protein
VSGYGVTRLPRWLPSWWTPARFRPQNGVSAVTRGTWSRHLMGVNQADGEIYRKHADELTRFATGLVGPSHAPDVVSEAVLRAMNSETWARAVDRRAYLIRCVYNGPPNTTAPPAGAAPVRSGSRSPNPSINQTSDQKFFPPWPG